MQYHLCACQGISWQPLRVFRLDTLLSATLALQLLCAAIAVCAALSARILTGTSRSRSALLSATGILALARLQFEKTQLEQRNKLTNVKHETSKFHLPPVPAIAQNLTLCRLQFRHKLSIHITTAFIYFSQGSPISPLRTVINRSPVHPKNYKIQYNLKISKRKFTHYNIAKTTIKEVKISSWPRRKPN